MIARIKKLFAPAQDENAADIPFKPDDYQIAAAALMIHVMKVDGDMDPAEWAIVQQNLQENYSVSSEEINQLLELAEKNEENAVDFYGFTSRLKRTLSEEERSDLIEQLWRTVYADGRLDALEDNIIWRIAELLGVSARDRMTLKRKILNEI